MRARSPLKVCAFASPEELAARHVAQADRHPSREALKRFMSGILTRAQAQGVVRHLLSGCPQCKRVTRAIWKLADRPFKDPTKAPHQAGHRPPSID